MTLRSLSAALAGALLVSACGGDSPSGPPPVRAGWVRVNLTTPNTNDGAVLVGLGAGVDSIRSTYRLNGQTSSSVVPVPVGTAPAFFVTGSIAAGQIAEVFVKDLTTVPTLSGTVREAAARSTYVQQNVAGYSVSFIAAP